MTEMQNKIAKLLWNFSSLREEQVKKICKCNDNDIDVLLANKVLVKDKKTRIIKYRTKEINNRNVVAFDVVMEYLDRNPEILKAKFPINVSMRIKFITYDIIAVKEQEIDNLYEEIDKISRADKIIIIIETKNYIKKKINTKRPCCICIYPPLDIVDMIN